MRATQRRQYFLSVFHDVKNLLRIKEKLESRQGMESEMIGTPVRVTGNSEHSNSDIIPDEQMDFELLKHV